jgi:hypothetical protein
MLTAARRYNATRPLPQTNVDSIFQQAIAFKLRTVPSLIIHDSHIPLAVTNAISAHTINHIIATSMFGPCTNTNTDTHCWYRTPGNTTLRVYWNITNGALITALRPSWRAITTSGSTFWYQSYEYSNRPHMVSELCAGYKCITCDSKSLKMRIMQDLGDIFASQFRGQ